MNWVPTTRLVARREIAERLRSRLIWVFTALTTLLVVALIVIPALVRQPAKATVVGLVGASVFGILRFGIAFGARGSAGRAPARARGCDPARASATARA